MLLVVQGGCKTTKKLNSRSIPKMLFTAKVVFGMSDAFARHLASLTLAQSQSHRDPQHLAYERPVLYEAEFLAPTSHRREVRGHQGAQSTSPPSETPALW